MKNLTISLFNESYFRRAVLPMQNSTRLDLTFSSQIWPKDPASKCQHMFGNENLKGELYVDFKGYIKTKSLLTEVESLLTFEVF